MKGPLNNERFEQAANGVRQARRGAKGQDPAKADWLPPHSTEAEQGVLGCILLSPEACLSECGERGVDGHWFYELRNRHVWQALWQLNEDGTVIDTITLQQHLREAGALADAGGVAYLASLPDAVPSAANLRYYVDILWEQWMARRVLGIASQVVGEIQQRTEGTKETERTSISDVIGRFERDVLALSENSAGNAEVHVRELVRENIDRLEDYHRGAAQITGLTTGLEYVDKVTGGLGGENGNFIVVAARPGMGKTSLGLDFLIHVALDAVWFSVVSEEERTKATEGTQGTRREFVQSKDGTVWFEKQRGRPAAFFTLEMSPVRLVRRMLFQRSGADLQRFRTGYALKEDFDKLGRASEQIGLGQVWIDGTKRLTIDMLKARCRRLARQKGIKMFVLDYLQLMKSDWRRYREPNRVAEMEEISGEIAALGCELDVPFFIVAQLNRDLDKAERKRTPQLSDIKNCGAIEQDADVVMMLHAPHLSEDKGEQWAEARAAAYPAGDWSNYVRRVNLLVEKNRDGATGDCELVFHKKHTHFEDYNAWLKRHGLKAPAKGEPKADRDDDLI